METCLRRLAVALAITFHVLCALRSRQIRNSESEEPIRNERYLLMHWKRKTLLHRSRRRSALRAIQFALVRRRFQRTRSIWTVPRSSRWWDSISTTWSDDEWTKHFRMRRRTFHKLCDTLRPWLTRKDTSYRKAVPVEARVAICVWRLATNLEYRSIGQLFGVAISTCCLITQEVVTAINVILKPQYIKHPSEAQVRHIVRGFHQKYRFPQVVGAIDGTHIKVRAPTENAADYYNRKGDHSIILQGVVDHNMMFWDINVGRPGKVHDACVFALSALYQRGINGTLLPPWTENIDGVEVPLLLLGDSAYPLLPWLMKPFPEGPDTTPEQLNYNHKLSQTRMTVERAFGRLKGRWRCLLKVNESHVTFISRIVSACCVLHNYCEVNHEEYGGGHEPAEDEAEEHHLRQPGQPAHQQPVNIREALCRHLSV